MMNDDSDMEMGGTEPEGSPVPCVHIYAMPDGSFGLKRSEEPAPEGLETAGSMEEAMERAQQMMAQPRDDEESAMASAQKGYARRAGRSMEAPGGGAIFGE